jgi:hypothetical protein
MSKFQVGDKVLYQNQLATITEVHKYMPTKTGRRKLLWYSVRIDGMHAQYAVAQITNSLRKAK